MKASMACPVASRAPARLEKELMTWVNHELYFFADARSKRKFDEKPWKYCGRLTDPVSRERFEPRRKSPRAEYKGRPYYFTSDSTRTAFLVDPEPRAIPIPMVPMARPDSTARADSAAGPRSP
jgi:YHS domain-containing protein